MSAVEYDMKSYDSLAVSQFCKTPNAQHFDARASALFQHTHTVSLLPVTPIEIKAGGQRKAVRIKPENMARWITRTRNWTRTRWSTEWML